MLLSRVSLNPNWVKLSLNMSFVTSTNWLPSYFSSTLLLLPWRYKRYYNYWQFANIFDPSFFVHLNTFTTVYFYFYFFIALPCFSVFLLQFSLIIILFFYYTISVRKLFLFLWNFLNYSNQTLVVVSVSVVKVFEVTLKY